MGIRVLRGPVFGVLVSLLLALAGSCSSQKKIRIQGAGATFPYPLYAQWAYLYAQKTGVEINYQSIGSGGGIAQIRAKTVDFGASDAPLPPEELEQDGLVQFPMVIGGVVPVVNLEGVGPNQLQLSPQVLARIFLGEIRRWNHPDLQALNPHLALPDEEITVVHRADGSGTTWIFTHYLSEVSEDWKNRVGTGKAVRWPTGIGGKGNEGVAAFVQQTPGAIGYVEYTYAVQTNLVPVKLQNAAGAFVEARLETFQAAAAHADWAHSPGFYVVLTNQPGPDAWPITGASFILLHREQPDFHKAQEMLKFFDWAYHEGAEVARKLHYVPVPPEVVTLVEDLWQREIRAQGRPVWPPRE